MHLKLCMESGSVSGSVSGQKVRDFIVGGSQGGAVGGKDFVHIKLKDTGTIIMVYKVPDDTCMYLCIIWVCAYCNTVYL